MIRRRYADPEQQALAFARFVGRSVTEGTDVMGMQDISAEEGAHRLKSGAPEKQLAARTKEGMKGLGIVKRDLYLGEKRAALAATMDPMMAKYNELQMQAVGLLGKVVDKLQELLGLKGGLSSKDRAEIKAQAEESNKTRSVGGFGGIGEFAKSLQTRNAKPNLPAPVGSK
jgi:hypothetical protein